MRASNRFSPAHNQLTIYIYKFSLDSSLSSKPQLLLSTQHKEFSTKGVVMHTISKVIPISTFLLHPDYHSSYTFVPSMVSSMTSYMIFWRTLSLCHWWWWSPTQQWTSIRETNSVYKQIKRYAYNDALIPIFVPGGGKRFGSSLGIIHTERGTLPRGGE